MTPALRKFRLDAHVSANFFVQNDSEDISRNNPTHIVNANE